MAGRPDYAWQPYGWQPWLWLAAQTMSGSPDYGWQPRLWLTALTMAGSPDYGWQPWLWLAATVVVIFIDECHFFVDRAFKIHRYSWNGSITSNATITINSIISINSKSNALTLKITCSTPTNVTIPMLLGLFLAFKVAYIARYSWNRSATSRALIKSKSNYLRFNLTCSTPTNVMILVVLGYFSISRILYISLYW